MSAPPMAILSTGLVTSVGLTRARSLRRHPRQADQPERDALHRFGRRMDHGAPGALEQPWRGLTKLAKMAAMAIEEALADVPRTEWQRHPAVAVRGRARAARAAGRAGRPAFARDPEANSGARFAPQSAVVAAGPRGGGGGAGAGARAARRKRDRAGLIAATDSLLTWPTLSHYERDDRLLTERNSNGFMPGEGAGALLVGAPSGGPRTACAPASASAAKPAHIDSGRAAARRRPVAGHQGRAGRRRLRRCTTWTSASPISRASSTTSRKPRWRCRARCGSARTSSTSGTRPNAPARSGPLAGVAVIALADAACRKGYAQRARTSWRTWPTTPASARRCRAAVPGRLMSNQVYANSMEVSCKAGGGQVDLRVSRRVLHAAADAGHAARRADSVSEHRHGLGHHRRLDSVKISGQEVMLKNKCYFKKSTGRRGRLRAEEGRDHEQEHGQGVLQCLVDGCQGRRRERRPASTSPPQSG